MASLIEHWTARRGDRGQLMLVTAFALAALFILLALVLNAVIYTENFATRESAGVDTIDASRYEYVASEAVGTAVENENAAGNSSYETMYDTVSRQTVIWSILTARHRATDARAVSVGLLSTTNGTRIVQNNSRPMTNVSNASDWRLVRDATAVGSFTMTVNQSSLVTPTNTTNAGELVDEGVYTVVFDNGTDVRQVFVYATGTNNVTVRVANSSGVLSPGCHASATGGTVTIDFVTRTVGGDHCSDLDALRTLDSPYNISYRDGANASGTYAVVTNRPAIDADLGDPDDGSSPYGERILYDATIEVRYVSPTLTYENVIRVPGGDWA